MQHSYNSAIKLDKSEIDALKSEIESKVVKFLTVSRKHLNCQTHLMAVAKSEVPAAPKLVPGDGNSLLTDDIT